MLNWKEYKKSMDRCGTCEGYNRKRRWCDWQGVPITSTWHQACSLYKINKGDIIED